jgi:hypothetical protein
MKNNDPEGKLSHLTNDDLGLYNIDGTLIDKNISLYKGAKFEDAKSGQF